MIPVDSPAFSVSLVRMTNRTNSAKPSFAKPFEAVDITPYLGMGGTIATQKSLEASCGAFSITFADRMHPEYGDTIYALAEPMDLIEIRGSRHPELYSGGKLPLIMRGFLSSVSRQEQIADDGTPYRSVVLVGQDSGKLLDIYRVLFQFAIATHNESYIETFKLQAMTGIATEVMGVSAWMRAIVSQVVNPKIEKMGAFTHQTMKPFKTDAIVVPDGLVAPQLAASIDSVSAWQLMEIFADKPWNELFVRDLEDGPQLVFRPAPYRSYDDGSYILPGATDPGTAAIDIADVLSLSVARSDARVANFYWVDVGTTQMDSAQAVSMMALAQGWPLDLNHDANIPAVFGERKMEARTNLMPGSLTKPFNKLSQGERPAAANGWVDWQHVRGRQLLLMNQDNSVFEEGSTLVRGNEDFAVGLYLQITRGDLVSQQYISSVAHQMAPLAGWTTQIGFIRGTGYKQRTEMAAPPAIAEGRRGPYS